MNIRTSAPLDAAGIKAVTDAAHNAVRIVLSKVCVCCGFCGWLGFVGVFLFAHPSRALPLSFSHYMTA